MRYVFDLDGTLCEHRKDGDHTKARPFPERIAQVRKLAEHGHHITIDTARGSMTGDCWLDVTQSQLERWGVPFDRLRVGTKPFGDYYVDDRAIPAEVFFGSH